MNIFEKALRLKLRWRTNKLNGITTEDLWDLSLEELNIIAKALAKEIKDVENQEGDLFDSVKVNAAEVPTLQLEIIKHIFTEKMEAKKALEKKAENRKERAKLADLIAKKQNEKLEGESLESLLEKFNQLSD